MKSNFFAAAIGMSIFTGIKNGLPWWGIILSVLFWGGIALLFGAFDN